MLSTYIHREMQLIHIQEQIIKDHEMQNLPNIYIAGNIGNTQNRQSVVTQRLNNTTVILEAVCLLTRMRLLRVCWP